MAELNSNEMMAAILSYLSILVFIPFFAIDKKNWNDFIKFHIEQGLNLFILEIIVWVVLFVLSFIPFIGLFFGFLDMLSWLFFIIISIVLIIRALRGEKWHSPIIPKIVKL